MYYGVLGIRLHDSFGASNKRCLFDTVSLPNEHAGCCSNSYKVMGSKVIVHKILYHPKGPMDCWHLFL